MSIKVLGTQWKQKMLIAGHYEFQILIHNTDESERTIYRRFSEIVWLQEGLLKKNPGCLIPLLPEKSVKFNLSVNVQAELDLRASQIETILNYINNHKYLSKNEYFLNFLSDEFSIKNTNENLNTNKQDEFEVIEKDNKSTKQGFMGKMFGLTSYLPSFVMGSQQKGLTQIEKDAELKSERENFLRLYTGVKELIENINNHIEINLNKTESIGNFIETAKNMNFTTLNYKAALNHEMTEVNENKRLKKNIESLKGYYDENRNYQNNYLKNSVKELNEFQTKVYGIIEIFERKKNQDEELENLKKNFPNKTEAIAKKKEFIDNFNEQLRYEIELFKREIEDNLIIIIKKFYQDKLESKERICELFNSNS